MCFCMIDADLLFLTEGRKRMKRERGYRQDLVEEGFYSADRAIEMGNYFCIERGWERWYNGGRKKIGG